MVHSGWSVDNGTMYQVPSTKYKVGISLDMNSTQKLSWYFACLPEVHGTWYLVPSTCMESKPCQTRTWWSLLEG